MRKLSVALVCVLFFILVSSNIVDAEETLKAKIDKAIKKGVEWLKKQQLKDGSFGDATKNPLYGGGKGQAHHCKLGICAFSLFALLKSDVPPNDPVIVKGFNFLEKNSGLTKSNYEAAVMILATEAKYQSMLNIARKKIKDPVKKRKLKFRLSRKDYKFIRSQVKFIKSGQQGKGGWRYGGSFGSVGGNMDVSATQFVLLGLKSASRCGVRVKQKVFLEALEYLLKAQQKKGEKVDVGVAKTKGHGRARSYVPNTSDKARGWAYIKNGRSAHDKKVTGSMTAAGVVGLIICKSELKNNRIYRMKYGKQTNKSIFDGLAWLNKHYTVTNNPNGFRGHYYYLYGLERVGMLGTIDFIGSHNWFVDGARHLVNAQKGKGFWDTKTEINPSDIIDTCYALLFLKKATTPVGVSVSRQ